MQKHFEVKTGKNKGFYIVTHNKEQSPEEYRLLADIWGIATYECNSTFYQRHTVSPQDLVWTHPHFAGHEFNRKHYAQLLQKLGCEQWEAFS